MMRTHWTLLARADLAAVDQHYRAINPDIAGRIGGAAIAAGRFLQDHPRAGIEMTGSAVRKWSVPRTPYLLLYRLRDDRIDILRVRHHASDWRNP